MTACIDGINKVLIGARHHGRPTLILEKMVYGSASAIEMRSSIDAEIRSKVLADLSELTVHVVREFDVFAEQQRRTLIIAATPCQIACDIDEIGILLRNLIDNALRYAPPGGRVRIACGELDASTRQSFLEVADDGPGVPAAERELIFRRFHRIEGNGGRGSGIGLSLVAGIARLHGASIVTGDGLDGRGFCVRVVVPAP